MAINPVTDTKPVVWEHCYRSCVERCMGGASHRPAAGFVFKKIKITTKRFFDIMKKVSIFIVGIILLISIPFLANATVSIFDIIRAKGAIIGSKGLRVDGEISRGSTAKPGDPTPVIVKDDLIVRGDIKANNISLKTLESNQSSLMSVQSSLGTQLVAVQNDISSLKTDNKSNADLWGTQVELDKQLREDLNGVLNFINCIDSITSSSFGINNAITNSDWIFCKNLWIK